MPGTALRALLGPLDYGLAPPSKDQATILGVSNSHLLNQQHRLGQVAPVGTLWRGGPETGAAEVAGSPPSAEEEGRVAEGCLEGGDGEAVPPSAGEGKTGEEDAAASLHCSPFRLGWGGEVSPHPWGG